MLKSHKAKKFLDAGRVPLLEQEPFLQNTLEIITKYSSYHDDIRSRNWCREVICKIFSIRLGIAVLFLFIFLFS
jgi:hypothetical protein